MVNPMCGICGMISKNAPVEREVLQRINQSIAHRGPDAEGLWIQGPVGLGHRRLAIIDIQGGKQPMSSRDGRYHLVYNGEIYNFQEIAKDLEKEGFFPDL